MNALCKTDASKIPVVARVLGGGPLLAFGAMHLSGAAPMKPLVEAAGFPAPELNAVLAPIAQVLAGLLILSGAFTRVGGVIAIATMLGALYTHAQIGTDEWPTPQPDGSIAPGPEPMFLMVLAVVIILASAFLLWKGAGAWSIDQKLCKPK